MIGGYALPAYGFTRTTEDIDIFIKPTKANAKKTIAALRETGYEAVNDSMVDKFLKTKVLIRQYVLDTDIHPHVTGVDFPGVWKRRIRSLVHGVEVFVPSLDDMLAMKLAANRDKDQEDIKRLREFKRQKGKNDSF